MMDQEKEKDQNIVETESTDPKESTEAMEEVTSEESTGVDAEVDIASEVEPVVEDVASEVEPEVALGEVADDSVEPETKVEPTEDSEISEAATIN